MNGVLSPARLWDSMSPERKNARKVEPAALGHQILTFWMVKSTVLGAWSPSIGKNAFFRFFTTQLLYTKCIGLSSLS